MALHLRGVEDGARRTWPERHNGPHGQQTASKPTEKEVVSESKGRRRGEDHARILPLSLPQSLPKAGMVRIPENPVG